MYGRITCDVNLYSLSLKRWISDRCTSCEVGPGSEFQGTVLRLKPLERKTYKQGIQTQIQVGILTDAVKSQ